MKRVAVLVSIFLTLTLVSMGSAQAAPKDSKPPTVVSFTFDGGLKSQIVAAEILERHNLVGTFYVNSGYIGYPAYLSLDQLRAVARGRHEIGGGSVHNLNLTKVETPKATREICNDRATLDRLGFQVTSFSYPYGADSQRVRSIVQKCGYNSARDVSGLKINNTECGDCPLAEEVPASDSWIIRADNTSVNLEWMTKKIQKVENSGGGWLPLIFTDVCVCPKNGDQAITPQDFAQFVQWVKERPETTSVMSVDQVIGGDYRKVIGKPLERLVPSDDPLGSGDVALSRVPAFTLGGIAITQAQLLATAMIAAFCMIVAFRFGSRKAKHVKH